MKNYKREYEILKEVSDGKKVYTASSGYSGGWKHANDSTSRYTDVLNYIGIKYIIGNDAPRGGLNGKFIKCHKFNAEKALEILKEKKIFDEGKKEGRAEILEDFIKLEKAIFGKDGTATSMSGNKYPFLHKPTPSQVADKSIPDFTPRMTAEGKIQVWQGGAWHDLNIN